MSKKVPQLGPFRRPEDMNLKLGEPQSIRFHTDTEALLKELAVSAEIGFSTFISGIADDYVAWFKKNHST